MVDDDDKSSENEDDDDLVDDENEPREGIHRYVPLSEGSYVPPDILDEDGSVSLNNDD